MHYVTEAKRLGNAYDAVTARALGLRGRWWMVDDAEQRRPVG
jgi:hypothetical protein